MKTNTNGKMYYQEGDKLYFPHLIDIENRTYIIDEVIVEKIENEIVYLKSNYYQKTIGPEYSKYSTLFLSKEEAQKFIDNNKQK